MSNNHTYIVGNGVVTDGAGIFFDPGAIKIEGNRISAVGPLDEIIEVGIEFFDVGGRLILPGLMNAHHHFYSALSTGISPLEQPRNFVGILENLWWPWDAALDEEAVYYSALIAAMECVRNGVTMVFDHHASMNFVQGSLQTIAKAVDDVGIRATLCFETSDRMGVADVEKHIAENIEFYESHHENKKIRGVFGLHANLTLSENTLSKIADEKPFEMPVHAHCGEDLADLQFCREIGYSGPVDRFDSFGLLEDDSILAHCIHLSDKDIAILKERDFIVACNSESNANNRVGFMNRKAGFPYVLGTDGMTSDMVSTLRSHYLLNSPSGIDFTELKNVFFIHRFEIQQKYFPGTGSLSPGSLADIAVLDYRSVTPIDNNNIIGHLVFGAKKGVAYLTIIDGEILYRDGAFINIDVERVLSESLKVSRKQTRRFYGRN